MPIYNAILDKFFVRWTSKGFVYTVSDTSSSEERSVGNRHAPLSNNDDEQKPERSERPATSDHKKEESSDYSEIVFEYVSTFCVRNT